MIILSRETRKAACNTAKELAEFCKVNVVPFLSYCTGRGSELANTSCEDSRTSPNHLQFLTKFCQALWSMMFKISKVSPDFPATVCSLPESQNKFCCKQLHDHHNPCITSFNMSDFDYCCICTLVCLLDNTLQKHPYPGVSDCTFRLEFIRLKLKIAVFPAPFLLLPLLTLKILKATRAN